MSLPAAASFPNLAYGPERLFGLYRLAIEGKCVVGEMTAKDAALGPGTLGVLVDDVLGSAILSARPPQSWSVSTEIAVDFVGPIPGYGGFLRAEGWLVSTDATGGLALGQVLDYGGNVIAHCRQRGRFVPMAGELVEPAPASYDALGGCFVVPAGEPGHLELAVNAELGNPLGNLHGGVALSVSERLAAQTLHDDAWPLTTASIHVAYARPIAVGTSARFSADTIHRGRTFGVSRVVSSGPAGRPCTIATVTQHP
jgi:uncharacterized protein (TIGR00369 family)